jgi:hypothetical protein
MNRVEKLKELNKLNMFLLIKLIQPFKLFKLNWFFWDIPGYVISIPNKDEMVLFLVSIIAINATGHQFSGRTPGGKGPFTNRYKFNQCQNHYI